MLHELSEDVKVLNHNLQRLVKNTVPKIISESGNLKRYPCKNVFICYRGGKTSK